MRAISKSLLFVAICAVCGSGEANAACPGSSLVNGMIANADQVMNLLDCKAPLDSAAFTGNVSINVTTGAALTANTGSGWSVFAHGDYASFLDASNVRGITIVTVGNATRLYSDYFLGATSNPLQLGAAPSIEAVNIWPSGNVGVGIVDPGDVRLSVLGEKVGDSLPANTGITPVGNLRINDKSNIALDIGQYNPSPVAWVQVHDSTNQSTNYPLALQVNGGGVGIGTISPSYTLQVNGSVAGTSWTALSDVRLKKNIVPIRGALALITQLRGVRYNWRPIRERSIGKSFKLPAGVPQVGFIAQELKRVLPEAVSVANEKGGTMSVAESKVVPVLVEAVKELQAINARQAMALANQAANLSAVRKELAAMERKIEVRTALR